MAHISAPSCWYLASFIVPAEFRSCFRHRISVLSGKPLSRCLSTTRCLVFEGCSWCVVENLSCSRLHHAPISSPLLGQELWFLLPISCEGSCICYLLIWKLATSSLGERLQNSDLLSVLQITLRTWSCLQLYLFPSSATLQPVRMCFRLQFLQLHKGHFAVFEYFHSFIFAGVCAVSWIAFRWNLSNSGLIW